jgi:hypothetical protein
MSRKPTLQSWNRAWNWRPQASWRSHELQVVDRKSNKRCVYHLKRSLMATSCLQLKALGMIFIIVTVCTIWGHNTGIDHCHGARDRRVRLEVRCSLMKESKQGFATNPPISHSPIQFRWPGGEERGRLSYRMRKQAPDQA